MKNSLGYYLESENQARATLQFLFKEKTFPEPFNNIYQVRKTLRVEDIYDKVDAKALRQGLSDLPLQIKTIAYPKQSLYFPLRNNDINNNEYEMVRSGKLDECYWIVCQRYPVSKKNTLELKFLFPKIVAAKGEFLRKYLEEQPKESLECGKYFDGKEFYNILFEDYKDKKYPYLWLRDEFITPEIEQGIEDSF